MLLQDIDRWIEAMSTPVRQLSNIPRCAMTLKRTRALVQLATELRKIST